MNDIQVIGAGMWRTGTVSLRSALTQLTGKSCLHMTDVIESHIKTKEWLEVVLGKQPNWEHLLKGYGSTLDWPTLAYWEQLAEYYPKAYILLSTRDPEEWWISISRTILVNAPTKDTAKSSWDKLVVELFDKYFIGRYPSHDQAIDFYNQHNELVRKTIPKDRLIDWKLGDGWAAICSALALPIPSEDFPHLNTTKDWEFNHR